MTYGRFLLLFLVLPILLLLMGLRRRLNRRRLLSLMGLMIIALLYTTPWDNYLVANGIWWYDPTKVLGWTFGWVPLEEYLFFMLQPLLTGLLLLVVLPFFRPAASPTPQRGRGVRATVSAALSLLWIGSLLLLALGGDRPRYLGLELAWALPPLLLQAAFGADLIARRAAPAALSLGTATLYLLAADAIAIESGVWTIDPGQTLGWNPLPSVVLEEALFFALTNALIIGALTLLEAEEAAARWQRWRTAVLGGG